ncbi:MAG: hypothetical protein FD135_2525 [Comamonadaceae bacterium]|nr:MAG: hypothetical protein FD135_2525 [Comamonadaceae bacterium]
MHAQCPKLGRLKANKHYYFYSCLRMFSNG